MSQSFEQLKRNNQDSFKKLTQKLEEMNKSSFKKDDEGLYWKPAIDKENSDPKLKTRPLMGLPILQGLNYSSGAWKDGKIYDPKNGKTYSCELTLKSPDVLEVTGYIGFSFVGRTVEWTRVKR